MGRAHISIVIIVILLSYYQQYLIMTIDNDTSAIDTIYMTPEREPQTVVVKLCLCPQAYAMEAVCATLGLQQMFSLRFLSFLHTNIGFP